MEKISIKCNQLFLNDSEGSYKISMDNLKDWKHLSDDESDEVSIEDSKEQTSVEIPENNVTDSVNEEEVEPVDLDSKNEIADTMDENSIADNFEKKVGAIEKIENLRQTNTTKPENDINNSKNAFNDIIGSLGGFVESLSSIANLFGINNDEKVEEDSYSNSYAYLYSSGAKKIIKNTPLPFDGLGSLEGIAVNYNKSAITISQNGFYSISYALFFQSHNDFSKAALCINDNLHNGTITPIAPGENSANHNMIIPLMAGDIISLVHLGNDADLAPVELNAYLSLFKLDCQI